VVTDPLDALTAARRSKDVEAGFKPVGETVGDLDGFVLGVIRGIEAVHHRLATVDGEIAVKFDHGVAGLDLIVTVDLDFVIVLRAGRDDSCENQTCSEKKLLNR